MDARHLLDAVLSCLTAPHFTAHSFAAHLLQLEAYEGSDNCFYQHQTPRQQPQQSLRSAWTQKQQQEELQKQQLMQAAHSMLHSRWGLYACQRRALEVLAGMLQRQQYALLLYCMST